MHTTLLNTLRDRDWSALRAAVLTGLMAAILIVASQGTEPAISQPDWHGNVARQVD